MNLLRIVSDYAQDFNDYAQEFSDYVVQIDKTQAPHNVPHNQCVTVQRFCNAQNGGAEMRSRNVFDSLLSPDPLR